MNRFIIAILLAVGLSPLPAHGGEADVEKVTISRMSNGSYRIDVTVRHGDTGIKHYANRWEVIGPDGVVLGTRTLFHPHENEQPFTRSLSGIKIPNSVKRVILRAHDNVHKFGGKKITVTVPNQ